MVSEGPVVVVGLGADGWAGLAGAARESLRTAGVVLGSRRQLGLLPPEVTAERVPWPTPLRPALPSLLAAHRTRGLAVLASGDPMWHGIGRAIVEELGTAQVVVHSHPSSVSLACAAMGWPVEAVDVVSLVTAPTATLLAVAGDGRLAVVLSRDADTPAAIAGLLRDNGFGSSELTVLSSLGSSHAARERGLARDWDGSVTDPLNVVAVAFHTDPGATRLGVVPGLPDEAFDHDGQLTKREVRALTLSALAPAPGELLWDVGGGSGSVAIEWLRASRACRAVSVERDPARAARISANAARLGVPSLRVVEGAVPEALAGLEQPQAVFIGGGLTAEGVVDACWEALDAGGRVVANAVTLESQAALVQWQARLGGDLTRIEVARAGAVGGFTAWRPAMPVVQWCAVKPSGAHQEGNPQ